MKEEEEDDVEEEGPSSWENVIVDPKKWMSSDSHGMAKFLLEAEKVILQEHGVTLVNTDEMGTLTMTNFRLLFVNEVSQQIIDLGSIPLATIEKFHKLVTKLPSGPVQSDKLPPRRLLKVIGKDMRIITFAFQPKTKQRRAVFDALWRYTKPTKLEDLYAFSCGSSKFKNANPKFRLIEEYCRLLGKGSWHESSGTFEDGSLSLSNNWWRITSVNSNYSLCDTYPFALIVPKSISDEELLQASSFRGRCRLPVITWCNLETGTVLARSSQPLVGIRSQRNAADEKLVAALCTENSSCRRKLYIADARPLKNAIANGALGGGGSESSSNYCDCEVIFFGIENIHTMRESLDRLRNYVDTHGATSSDGVSSFLRDGVWTWSGGNRSSMSESVSCLSETGWLGHVQALLAGSAWIAARISLESASVLVHCSDGWDRTSQMVSLSSLMLDPYYRTFKGFQALVEKDWLAFGHQFSERMGLSTVSLCSNTPFQLSRQYSVRDQFSSSMRTLSRLGSTSSVNNSLHGQASNETSPIFVQWVDCVSQLLHLYPCAFEFSSAFLVDFLDCVLSCRFGNFLFNSEKERHQNDISDACGCIWIYLSDLRASGGGSHNHFNLLYDPIKYDGPLLPPAAALAPSLWPQFHLRWSCPSEAQAGEVDYLRRIIAKNYDETTKAISLLLHLRVQVKDNAEMKVKELKIKVHSLTEELHIMAKDYVETTKAKEITQVKVKELKTKVRSLAKEVQREKRLFGSFILMILLKHVGRDCK